MKADELMAKNDEEIGYGTMPTNDWRCAKPTRAMASQRTTTPLEKWKTMSAANIGNNFQTLASRDDLTERLSEVSQPTLIIHGDADIAIPMERAQVMADKIPDAELVVIPGAGHAANLSHPDPVNQALDNFLERL